MMDTDVGRAGSEFNPEQILKSCWVLTWKSPEKGQKQRRAKACLVVLSFQDPKLVDVPTLPCEGRALVLQTAASKRLRLSSFDMKTAFLRGQADLLQFWGCVLRLSEEAEFSSGSHHLRDHCH